MSMPPHARHRLGYPAAIEPEKAEKGPVADERASGPVAFEYMIARARAGEISRADLMLAFLDALVVVPSGSDVAAGRGTVQPVQVERGGVTWMVVYTSLVGANQVGSVAPLP